jgi:hypothetical protein
MLEVHQPVFAEEDSRASKALQGRGQVLVTAWGGYWSVGHGHPKNI